MPVQTLYDDQLIIEECCQNGKYHNENGPAVRFWNDDGQLIIEEFWLNDNHHNENGPAIREWDNSDGQLIREEFWLNGIQVDSLPDPNEGKVVEIDGRKYLLTAFD